MPGTGYYLYGVIKDVPLKGLITGIKKEGVFTASCDGIAGVLSCVNLDEFGESSLKRNLESIEWLKENVFSHERVIEEVMSETTIIPVKFCTIFNSTDSVLELLGRKHDWFLKLLERCAGKSEWGIKAYCRKGQEPADKKVRSGREYLFNKEAEQDMKSEREARVNAAVEEVFQKMKLFAEDSRVNRPTPQELVPDKDKEQVLNASLLVKKDEADRLTVLVNELAREYKESLTLELAGPLPVYSFVSGSPEGI